MSGTPKKTGGSKSPKTLCLRLELDGRTLFETRADALAGELSIGRAQGCAWRIPATDKTASNRHAVLFRKRGRLFIRDDGSKNGLYFMGQKFQEHKLADGDSIAIGDCRLVVEASADHGADKLEFHRLEQLNGAEAGRVIELHDGGILIGSDPGSGIVCGDRLVSHRHAELSVKHDGCWVKDLESRNGSMVNKVALRGKERMLRDGDILSIAYLEFRFLDCNAVHVRSHFGVKIAAAAVTAALLTLGYYAVNIYLPDSKTVTERAVAAAREGRFEEAERLMDEAATARSAGAYKERRQAVLRDLPEWRATFAAWDKAREFLAGNLWVSASRQFDLMSKWPRGMETEENRALSVKRLNNALLAARLELSRDEPGQGKTIETLAEKGAELQRALEGVEAAHPVEPEWLERLAGFSRDLAVEIETTRGEWARVEKALSNLGEKSGAAAAAILEVGEVLRENTTRGEFRAQEQESGDKPYMNPGSRQAYILFSGLVGARCDAVLPHLRELAACDALLARKVENIAMRRDAAPEAPVFGAARAPHEKLAAHRAALEAKNKELDAAAALLKARMDAVDAAGFDPVENKLSVAMASLLNETFMDEVFAFLEPGAEHPSFNQREPAGSYDKMVGVHYFKTFLDGPADWRPGDWKTLNEHWIPRIVDARLSDDLLKSLLRTANNPREVPEALRRELWAVPGSRVKAYVEFAQKIQDDLMDWREDVKSRAAPGRDPLPRTRVLALGMLVMMNEKPPAKDLEELSGEWRALTARINRGMDEAQLLAEGFPGVARFETAWKKQYGGGR